MSDAWKYEPDADGYSGVLLKRDGPVTYRPIVRIGSRDFGGHCVDTGAAIAAALNAQQQHASRLRRIEYLEDFLRGAAKQFTEAAKP